MPKTELPELRSFDRVDFLADRWGWRPGEHVTVLGPTGCGKTTLLLQLAYVTASRRTQAVIFATKPKDDTLASFAKGAKWPVVRSWPPLPGEWIRRGRQPAGYVLWPKHRHMDERDDAEHARVFREAIRYSYKRGSRILVMDEADSIGDLRETSKAPRVEGMQRVVYKRGRSMRTSAWAASQRPYGLLQEAYSQAQHLFIFNDPDRRSRERFGEIGGVDPDIVRTISAQLPDYWALYLRRRGRRMCLVAP